jgi:hypothetical protein
MSTSNGGRDWTPLSPDFTGSRASILALAASDVMKGLLWVGLAHGGVRLTRDHGGTWASVSIPGVDGGVVSIDASHQNAAEAFAAVATGDNRPHIYRTRDFGSTWTEAVTGLPADEASGSFVNAVRTDTRASGLVFAATESSMYVSFDAGERWQPLRLNLPTTSVRDIVVHDNDLVIATFGRGIWVLDDYSPLRQLTRPIERERVHLFEPGDAVRVRRDINGDTPFPPEIPQAQNPPPGALIYYSLSMKPSTTVTIEIADAEGRVIRHLSSAPTAPVTSGGREFPDWWLRRAVPLPTDIGLNRVNWDVRYDDPPSAGEHVTIRAVPGDTPTHYEGPLALPGVYTVRLTVDGTSYTQKVTVKNDPRSTATPADLAAQHDLQMRLYGGIKDADAAATLAKTAGGNPPPPFDRIRDTLNQLLEELDSADFAPTPSMTHAYGAACRELRTALTALRDAQPQAAASTALPACGG